MGLPPRKPKGKGSGRRSFNGALLDVTMAATFLGTTPKSIRAKVGRGLLPYRRWGSRIVFIKSELEQFLNTLPGLSLEEVQSYLKMRRGDE